MQNKAILKQKNIMFYNTFDDEDIVLFMKVKSSLLDTAKYRQG